MNNELLGELLKLALSAFLVGAPGRIATLYRQVAPLRFGPAEIIALEGQTGVGILPEYPVLAGQHEDYLRQALRDYRSGKRQNAIMNGFAAPLTDADIRELAAHFARQPGLHTPRAR